MKIEILTTPGCQICARVKEIFKKLKVKYVEIDVTKKPEYLQKYPIATAPGIVIDGKLEFSGGVTEEQLRKKLKI